MSTNSTSRNEWPYTTPSGHTYEMPKNYDALKQLHDEAALASIEGWDEPEHPPEPVWEMLAPAHRTIMLLQARCDKMTGVINRRDPDRHWREFTIVMVGFAVGSILTRLVPH